MGLTPKQHRRVNLCNFSYFCAVLVPHCPRDKLGVVSDWGNWVSLNERLHVFRRTTSS
jgi:hypothetical protein